MGELQGTKRTSAQNPPSVEPLEDFIARILAWWDSTIMPLLLEPVTAGSPTKVLVIGHGSYLANLIKALGSKRGYNVGKAGQGKAYNTGISILEVLSDDTGRLIQYSDIKHLEGMEQDVVKTNVDDVDAKAGRSG